MYIYIQNVSHSTPFLKYEGYDKLTSLNRLTGLSYKHIKDGGHSMIADVSMVKELLATAKKCQVQLSLIYLLSYKRSQ